MILIKIMEQIFREGTLIIIIKMNFQVRTMKGVIIPTELSKEQTHPL